MQTRSEEPSKPLENASSISPGSDPPRRDGSNLENIPISPGNDGIRALEALVKSMRGHTQNKDRPIVLVSGFSGWGRPLFGTINYWGGFEHLPEVLAGNGYKVIVVRIGPISSNRERACEIWTQLRNINNETDRGYNLPNDVVPTPLRIQYGNHHPAEPLGYLNQAQTWQPVVFGDVPPNWSWNWGKENPVHFICHSQGGNSVRYLIEMLTGTHTDLFPASQNFPTNNCQDWVASVVTIGTPHKGTTVTDVVQDLFPSNFFELLTRVVWSTSFDRPQSRFYDLQLDHWGFFRGQNEPLSNMHTRLANLIPRWWNANAHGLHDNSMAGVGSLNGFAPNPSQHTYYFTMSFCATDPFPNLSLGQQDINELLALFPLDGVFNPFGLLGTTLPVVLQIFSQLPFLPRLRNFAEWLTNVANRHLRSLGYFSHLPRPGNQVPRADMLPLIAIPAYAMGGYRLNNARLQALGGITSEEYQRNDGIVNTTSMNGPVNATYGLGSFPGPGIHMADKTRARGMYWHLGENVTIDHADQIGVFTSGTTSNEVKYMYLLFARLITRL